MKRVSPILRWMMAIGLSALSAHAMAGFDGVWRTEEGTLYRFAPCAEGWCAVYLGLAEIDGAKAGAAREGCGMQLASGLQPDGESWLRGGQMKGRETGKDARISVHALSADKLEILLYEQNEAQAERLIAHRDAKHSGRCEK